MKAKDFGNGFKMPQAEATFHFMAGKKRNFFQLSTDRHNVDHGVKGLREMCLLYNEFLEGQGSLTDVLPEHRDGAFWGVLALTFRWPVSELVHEHVREEVVPGAVWSHRRTRDRRPQRSKQCSCTVADRGCR